jgi:hypothetical protein
VSTEHGEVQGVSVNTFCGPDYGDGEDRRHVQITVAGEYIQLTMRQWDALGLLLEALGPECRGMVTMHNERILRWGPDHDDDDRS